MEIYTNSFHKLSAGVEMIKTGKDFSRALEMTTKASCHLEPTRCAQGKLRGRSFLDYFSNEMCSTRSLDHSELEDLGLFVPSGEPAY